MENYKSRIGKSQMRQYMGDLYENPMVVYREYIQNACDAIEDALSMDLLQDRKKTTIVVEIDNFNKTIVIEDKGIGIAKDEIAPRLVDVASSKKVGRAGQYGIGRLNGANYCDQIKYETTAYGECIKSTLVWDVKKAREICNDPDLDPTTEEIIDEVTHLLPTEQEDSAEHYCRVTLVNVNNEILLDKEKVIEYIAQIVPVDYSLDFKDNLLKPSLELGTNSEYKERFKFLWIYKISVNNIPVEKKYASEIESFKFGSMKCFTLIDNKTQEEYAWGWYAMNEEAKQMNDIPVSFIRARHCNYQIGPSTLLSASYPSPVSQAYFIGEIHLVNTNLLPTASRDGIKQNDTKLRFEIILKKFFKELYTLYNKTSKFRSEVVDKIAEANVQIAALTLRVKQEEDASEKAALRDKIKKCKDDREKAEVKSKAYAEFFNETQSWNAAEDVVRSVNKSTIKTYNQKSDVVKKDLQIQALNVEIFKSKLDNPASTAMTGKESGQNNQSLVNGTNVDNHSNGESIPQKPKSELDVYINLSSVERKLIKQFYSVINAVDLPQATKDRIKKNLKNKILK